jgi:membrane-associated PAP2 superfamily phosphatase
LLYAALGIGLLFGIAQQVRGAHMLSHDLFTLAICWSSCLVWSVLLLPDRQQQEVATGVRKT